jgi:nitrate/TMAO reductase-like tetraheme cytochrome c subunit
MLFNKPKNRGVRIVTTKKVTIGVVSVIAVIIVLLLLGTTYGTTPSFCNKCHVIKKYVTSWEDSSHAAHDVSCLDCHAKQGKLDALSAHAGGLGRLFKYYTGKYKKPKVIVSNNTCLRCHLTTRDVRKRSVLVRHYEVHLSKKGAKCTDCHVQLVHKAPKTKLAKPVKGNWIGAKACGNCHFEVLAEWKEARHAGALETLVNSKMDSSASCLPCHTVGFDKGGFISTSKTHELGGVQCENCHKSGFTHSQHPADVNIPSAALASDTCTQCHQGTHHPTDVEWKSSAHAKALETLKKSDHAEDKCLGCHSADYILAPEGEKPTLKEAEYTITCVVCHKPHNGELRTSRDKICTNCHTAENAVPPQPVHHPTKELFLGITLKNSGVPNPPVFAKHVNNGVTCVDCHMFTKEFVSEDEPGVTGHFYESRPEACLNCHSEWNTAAATKQIQTIQAPVVSLMTELEPKINEGKEKLEALKKAKKKVSKIQPLLDVAVFDFDFVKNEPSKGFHNPEYAKTMLETSKNKLDEFMKQAEQ